MSPYEPLDQAELNAIQVLAADLAKHTAATKEAFDLLGEALGLLPELPVKDVSQSRKVVTALLVRLVNDLRCAALLGLRGYPSQAAAIVASMYEVAYAAAYIGADDALAQLWIDHNDPTSPFLSPYDLTKRVLTRLGVAQQLQARYRVYQQLCMAKHANPLFEMDHAYELRPTEVASMNGPRTSDSAIRAARFALEHAAGLSFVAVASFVNEHIPAQQRDLLKPRIRALGDSSRELSEESAQRYGTQDPYPGKW